jgi:hypothetical protein
VYAKRFILIVPLLLWASRSRADSFQAGSLIIPTDECYQGGATNAAPWAPSGATPAVREGWSPDGTMCTWYDANSTLSTNGAPYYGACWAALTTTYGATSTGLQHAFGVLYLLAKNNIPVSIINRTDKQALGDYDFSVAPTDSGNPVYYLRWSSGYQARNLASTGGAPVYYRGMPFVVAAAYAEQALAVLTASNNAGGLFSDVTLHVARADFQAPVAALIATTPKPIGVINYGNSNGFNIATKYMTDAGLIYALTGSTATTSGEGVAYTTISLNKQGSLSYTFGGAPSAACNNGRCSTLTYLLSGVRTRILDVVWAPDINQGTCPDVQPNPSCFDSTTGLCKSDSCLGPSAWCCPAGSQTPSYSPTFSYTNPDGTVTPYYCPCPQAGASNNSDQCTIANWQYDATPSDSSVPTTCYAALDSPNNPCGNGNNNSWLCDYGSQQCMQICNNDSACPAGSRCVTGSTGPTGCSGNNCPVGYTCGSGTCVTNTKICVRQQTGQNPSKTPTCTTSCASDSYCDPTDNSCKPKWGCELVCSSCPNSNKLSNVWSSTSTMTGGFNDYLSAGGTLLGTDTTALTAESQLWLSTAGLGSTSAGSASGTTFCASAVQNSPSASAIAGFTSATPSYPASNLYLQIGDYLYRALGGNSPVYTLGASQFKNTFVSAIAYAMGSGWAYPAMTGPPGACTTTNGCTTCTIGGLQQCQIEPSACGTQGLKCGTVIYEGANNFASSASSAPLVKAAGQHIVYDSLIQGTSSGSPVNLELARSSPITQPVTGQYAIGTFDWKYTRPTPGSGITQWEPPSSAYPWTTGHFRLYTPAAADAAGSFSSAGSSAVWDVDSWISGPTGGVAPPRTILFAYKSGTTWTLQTFTASNNDKVAQQMFGVVTTTAAQRDIASKVITKVLAVKHLGGVDFGTPAIIEAPHGLVAGNAGTRPTVAYVGARDGMLHAVCVAAKGGTIGAPGTCYGKNPGAELWAIIPPTVLSQMATAYTSNDWSNINVGGTIRVADVFDYLVPSSPTTRAWKTVLMVGLRSAPAVAAFDISNPDPGLYNSDDFRFLWEANASNTTPPMGLTAGGTIATPSVVGVGLVASATNSSSTGSGINVYMLRMSDGAVLDYSTRTYTKSLPSIVSAGTLPNIVPPVPTVLDSDENGLDDAAYVADAQGEVVRVSLTSSSFTSGLQPLFDASTHAGCTTTACQPFGASPAVMRRAGSTPAFALLAASGGTDWASTSTTSSYYFYGIDPTTVGAAAPMFRRALGSLQVPVPFGGGTTRRLPLRSYAQPTVIGTDAYIDGTTLSLGNIQQLLQPVLYDGIWGENIRYLLDSSVTDASVSAAQYIVPVGGQFGGGYGTTLFVNNTMIEVGTSGVVQHPLTSLELQTSQPFANSKLVPTTLRSYKVLNWFEME